MIGLLEYMPDFHWFQRTLPVRLIFLALLAKSKQWPMKMFV